MEELSRRHLYGIIIFTIGNLIAAVHSAKLSGVPADQGPSPPRNFRATSQKSTSLTLVWDAPENWNGHGIGYSIKNQDTQISVRLDGIKNRVFEATGLTPFQNHTFVLTAVSQVGTKEVESKPVSLVARTSEYDEPSPPRNFRVFSQNLEETNLVWDQPLKWNAPTGGYIITYSSYNSKVATIKIDNKDETGISLNGLQPWSLYNVEIVSYNELQGEVKTSSPEVLFIQPTQPLPKPVYLIATEITASSVNLTWKNPKNLPNVSQYAVYYMTDEEIHTDYTKTPQIQISNLKPWTLYEIKVASVYNIKNNSVSSENATIIIRTNFSAPSKPRLIRVTDVGARSLTLEWKEPLFNRKPFCGYMVTWDDGLESKNLSTRKTNYIIKDLKPWTSYNVSVTAFNCLDTVKVESEPVDLQSNTLVSEPSEPVEFAIGDVTNTSLTATWEKPLEPNGPIDGYVLTCSDLDGMLVLNVTTFNKTYTFQTLHSWREYNFTVTAFNMVINESSSVNLYGPPANGTNKTSAGVAPNAKQNLTVASTEKETASLNVPIQLFSEENGPIIEYILLIAAKNNEDMVQMKAYETLNETAFHNWYDSHDTENWYRSSPQNWIYTRDDRICKDGDKGYRKCEVGVEKSCKKGQLCDGPLKAKTKYWAKVRAYTDGGWTETFPVPFTTGGQAALKPTSGVLVMFFMAAVYKYT